MDPLHRVQLVNLTCFSHPYPPTPYPTLDHIASQLKRMLKMDGPYYHQHHTPSPIFLKRLYKITSLPNELLLMILSNFEADGQLLNLREVGRRWCAVIESIFAKKRTLILTSDELERSLISCSYRTTIERRFFGQIDLSNAFLVQLRSYEPRLESYLPYNFVNFFSKLFPALETLIITCELNSQAAKNLCILLSKLSPSLVNLSLNISPGLFTAHHSLFDHLCKLEQLKRLDLCGCIISGLHLRLGLILVHLEHVSFTPSNDSIFLMEHLAPTCTQLWLDAFCLETLNGYLKLNPFSVRLLTHLRLSVPKKNAKEVVHLICGHFRSLRVLDLDFGSHDHLFEVNYTVSLFPFGNLRHLTSLALTGMTFDLAEMRLQPILSLIDDDDGGGGATVSPGVKTLNLAQIWFNYGNNHVSRFAFNGEAFCMGLAAVFPNLEYLAVDDKRKEDRMAEYLGYFGKLKSYRFG